MEKTQITIDQLKNYLGTGLKVKHPYEDTCWVLDLENSINTISIKTTFSIEAKPLCYRLSDLDKLIPELGFVPIKELTSKHLAMPPWFGFSVEKDERNVVGYRTPESWIHIMDHFLMFQKLFSWNFWPFGDEYFEQGLIIDKLKQ